MPAIDWTTTKTALDAAIATADGSDLTLLRDVRRRLTRTGEGYDALWNLDPTDVDAGKTANTTAFADAYAQWAVVTYEPAHVDADKAARHAESLEVAALSSTSATPYVTTVEGVRIVLAPAPAQAIAVAYEETPIATAARTLVASATGVLRIVAKDTGTAGNRVEIEVANATSGGSKRKITARLGTFTEAYDEIAAGDAIDVSSSLLLASATWLVSTLPDTAAYANLTGGAGGSYAAVAQRIARAKLLPAAVDQVATIESYRVALERAFTAKPTFDRTAIASAYTRRNRPLGVYYFGQPTSVYEAEVALAPLIAEADALLAAATY